MTLKYLLRLGALASLLLMVASPLAGATFAQDRVALLIANWDFASHSLPEVKEEVSLLAQALTEVGFTVTLRENVTDFSADLKHFAASCPTGGISLFYFSGQGKSGRVTKAGAALDDDGGILGTGSNEPYSLDKIAAHFRENSPARLHMQFFDCARPGPQPASETRGLQFRHDTWPGTLVCSAMPPETMLPMGTASLLAESLTRHLTRKGQDIGAAMARVQEDVAQRSGGMQEVWFRFASPRDASAQVAPTKQRKISTDPLPPADPEAGDEWINGQGMLFCWCPPGSFRMGLAGRASQVSDARSVEVTISQGFWIGKYELTYADYVRAGKGPLISIEVVPKYGNMPLYTTGAIAHYFGPKQLEPAERKRGRLPDGWTYRVPTEAEWEYACRAGTTSDFSFGDSASDLHRYANYADATLSREDDSFYYCDLEHDDGIGKGPAPIGSYAPNAWGLHDMHGNLSEFVEDTYADELLGGTDPRYRRSTLPIVCRGGAWCSTSEYCLAGFRNKNQFYGFGFNYLGTRLVLAKVRTETSDKK